MLLYPDYCIEKDFRLQDLIFVRDAVQVISASCLSSRRLFREHAESFRLCRYPIFFQKLYFFMKLIHYNKINCTYLDNSQNLSVMVYLILL